MQQVRMTFFLARFTRQVDSPGRQEILGLRAGQKQKLTKQSIQETWVLSLNPLKTSRKCILTLSPTIQQASGKA